METHEQALITELYISLGQEVTCDAFSNQKSDCNFTNKRGRTNRFYRKSTFFQPIFHRMRCSDRDRLWRNVLRRQRDCDGHGQDRRLLCDCVVRHRVLDQPGHSDKSSKRGLQSVVRNVGTSRRDLHRWVIY